MTREEFAEIWGYKTAIGYGSAMFDCRENILNDLDKLIGNEVNNIKEVTTGTKQVLLFDFFMWFRENGEKHLNISIEKMIDIYLDK